MTNYEAGVLLIRVNQYLRKAYGRPATEAPRRVITAALRCIGTEQTVNVDKRYLKRLLV
jgi:hypothetical protein